MDDDLTRNYRRWMAAEALGEDEEADAACRAVFEAAIPQEIVAPGFAADTLQAIASAAARDQAQARRTRRAIVAGGTAAGVVGLYYGGGWAISALATVLLGLLDMLVAAMVRVATGMQAGADVWTLLASIGRAVGAFVSNPAVTVAMLAMQGIAIAALFALQRLLGSDRESFK